MLLPGLGAADALRDATLARRRLQYDAAAATLDAAIPAWSGDARARGLLLRAGVTKSPDEARRFLLDAERSAAAADLRQQANLELARLEYARGNYRTVRTRLTHAGADPAAALLLAQSAAALGEPAAMDAALVSVGDADWAQALRGWAALQRGAPREALDLLTPVAGRSGADVLPTVLLWKAEAEAKLGNPAPAARTAADLRARFPGTPEAAAADHAARSAALPSSAAAGPADEHVTLQIASFEDRANALRLRETLRAVPGIRMEHVTVGGKPVYRVSAGDFPSREAAEEFARTQLVPRGANAQVVRLESANR